MPGGSKAPTTFLIIGQRNGLPSSPYLVLERGDRKVIFWGGSLGEPSIKDWISGRSPGLSTCDGEAVGQLISLDTYFKRTGGMGEEGDCFSNFEWPDAKFLKPLGLSVDDLMSTIPFKERIDWFLGGLNPSNPDFSSMDEIFCPPTRRCEKAPMIQPSLPTTKDSDQEYVPKHFDGSDVLLPKTGIEGLKTAWKYDVFPLYVKEDGIYWDFREAFDLEASDFGAGVDLVQRFY
ncbi:hypothetical protein RUND412_001977 [Rhizina undulata]